VLKTNIKAGSAFFNRNMKKAFAEPTYRAFVESMHTLIHKDCGQIRAVRPAVAVLVNTLPRNISSLAALIDAV
jgi:hypothetical protein